MPGEIILDPSNEAANYTYRIFANAMSESIYDEWLLPLNVP